jgi:hypothetical protein
LSGNFHSWFFHHKTLPGPLIRSRLRIPPLHCVTVEKLAPPQCKIQLRDVGGGGAKAKAQILIPPSGPRRMITMGQSMDPAWNLIQIRSNWIRLIHMYWPCSCVRLCIHVHKAMYPVACGPLSTYKWPNIQAGVFAPKCPCSCTVGHVQYLHASGGVYTDAHVAPSKLLSLDDF